jgi:lipopolysaccharide transport system ATP-binding protein
MSNVVIKVENISKLYRLGNVNASTLKDDFQIFRHKLLGKENPTFKLAESNEHSQKSKSNYVWALKNINFEVMQGEVLGIIGKNGAGKSTLLKILSKVTSPSTGSIKVKGRIASLLEVGTGFHPELTGKENMYLNGHILGMSKKEIDRKFDEIVDFAGIERYLDTPVKRYSSGMYVRLAFAVAAHLEPEILIVDEVLAVGDIEFQKKAIGKMQEVSRGDGRTVIFVSHSMDTIERLCNKSILLSDGIISNYGLTKNVISDYLKTNNNLIAQIKFDIDKQPAHIITNILEAYVHDENYVISETFDITKKIGVSFRYIVHQEEQFIGGIDFYDERGNVVFNSHDVNSIYNEEKQSLGEQRYTVWIPGNLLAEGIFSAGVALFKRSPFTVYQHLQHILKFKVIDYLRGDSARGLYNAGFPGIVRPLLNWETIKR